ncbi:MAG TPA: hypothetical protein VKJ07_12060 [Mycobacteriales bacterium]|nr:hypothetical protein [Mycobacteriales bacterium]
MYWLGVGAAYLTLLGVGLFLGHWLANRRRGWGRGDGAVSPPAPVGPAHAVDWMPLGTEFDRALLPAAFTGEAVAADAA